MSLLVYADKCTDSTFLTFDSFITLRGVYFVVVFYSSKNLGVFYCSGFVGVFFSFDFEGVFGSSVFFLYELFGVSFFELSKTLILSYFSAYLDNGFFFVKRTFLTSYFFG